MQSYTPLGDTATTTVKEAVLNHENNINAIRSTNSGTAFPTDNLEEGMHCYRTDLSKDYIYTGGEWKEFLGDYAKSDDIANEVSTKSLTVTGETSVPTPDTANNSTTIANTSFVHGVVNELVNGAPTALDTLQELATALGNDPNFSTTVLDKIGEKESKTDANVEYAAIRSEAASTYATKTEVDTKQDKGNYVEYTANANITYGVNTGKTYTYSQSPMVLSNGIVLGGTSSNAGLMTRGICGVTSPATTGACTKSNLYLNYDGDNKYERETVLGAVDGGDAITTSTSSSTDPTYTYGRTYSAVRGDQMVNYVNAKVGTLSTVAHTGSYTDLTNKPSIPSKTSELTNDSNYVVSTALSKVATSGSYSDLTNTPTVDGALSSTSANAIQNKAVNTALAQKVEVGFTNKPQIQDYDSGFSEFALYGYSNAYGKDCYTTSADISRFAYDYFLEQFPMNSLYTAKANVASPTFTGTVTAPTLTVTTTLNIPGGKIWIS
jgi:hypothetical protein